MPQAGVVKRLSNETQIPASGQLAAEYLDEKQAAQASGIRLKTVRRRRSEQRLQQRSRRTPHHHCTAQRESSRAIRPRQNRKLRSPRKSIRSHPTLASKCLLKFFSHAPAKNLLNHIVIHLFLRLVRQLEAFLKNDSSR
jgi:hypothetical protein